jgi:hypothetical protein
MLRTCVSRVFRLLALAVQVRFGATVVNASQEPLVIRSLEAWILVAMWRVTRHPILCGG